MEPIRLVPSTTTDEREALLLECQIQDGVECHHCGHVYRVYKRSIHGKPAWFLLQLVKLYRETGDWVHSRTLIPGAEKSSTDAAYANAWGLVRKHPDQHGLYKPTFFGCLFVDGELLVPAHAFINNHRRTCLGFTDELVSIHEALATKFDYDDLNDLTSFTRKNGEPI